MRNTGLLLLSLAAAIPACSDDADNTATPDAAVNANAVAKLSPSSDALGAHVLDKDGKTLYFYVKDVAGSGVSACDTTCQTTWKLADLGATTTVGDGLTAADFGVTTSGTTQTTWKGRPLYYFTGDTAAGATTGEAKGGLWFVARAYNVFFAIDPTTMAPPIGSTDKTTPVLTAGNGHTIYVFKVETPATASAPPVTKCGVTDDAGTGVGVCAKTWPLWEKPAALTTPVVPSTLKAADFASFSAEGGKLQFTYKGWPTYFFAPADSSTPPVNTLEAAGKSGGVVRPNWFAISAAWDGKTF